MWGQNNIEVTRTFLECFFSILLIVRVHAAQQKDSSLFVYICVTAADVQTNTVLVVTQVHLKTQTNPVIHCIISAIVLVLST